MNRLFKVFKVFKSIIVLMLSINLVTSSAYAGAAVKLFDRSGVPQGLEIIEGRLSISIADANGNLIGVDNPLPIDSLRLYPNDINLTASVVNSFISTVSGQTPQQGILNLVQSNLDGITNTSDVNPKVLKIAGNFDNITAFMDIRTAEGAGNFSNVKIIYRSINGNVNKVLDLSTDDTKLTELLFDHNISGYGTLEFYFYTDDPVTFSRLVSLKSQDVTAKLLATSIVDDSIETIKSFKNSIQVEPALNHTFGIGEPFSQLTGIDTTLTVAAESQDTSITVANGGLYAEDQLIVIADNGASESYNFKITGIATNVLTLDRPLDTDHAIGTNVKGVITNMAVLGSLAAPQSFKVQPPPGEVWQLARELIVMTSETAMRNGLFGSLPPLTNGVVVRVFIDGEWFTTTTWRTGADMVQDMFNVEYPLKVPAGDYSLQARWTFISSEFILELNGDNGDFAEVLIQDDLTDLATFHDKAWGRHKFN